jgi:hypothetical protein
MGLFHRYVFNPSISRFSLIKGIVIGGIEPEKELHAMEVVLEAIPLRFGNIGELHRAVWIQRPLAHVFQIKVSDRIMEKHFHKNRGVALT